MADDRYKSWRDRHPWLYYRTVHLLVERGLEDLTDLRRCGLDPFQRLPNVGENVVQQLRWLIERGEEPMPPGFRFPEPPKPERFYSVWRIVIGENHSKKAVASALRRLADRVERAPRNRLSRVRLHDADGQYIGVASVTRETRSLKP